MGKAVVVCFSEAQHPPVTLEIMCLVGAIRKRLGPKPGPSLCSMFVGDRGSLRVGTEV